MINKKDRKLVDEGYQEKIIIKDDDIDLNFCGEEFIKNLEEEYESFLANITKKQMEYEALKKSMDISPIKISLSSAELEKKSPITIIDAPWGTGKTHFIESLVENISLKKVTPKKINNVVILDSWKLSNIKNTTEEIISELFYNLNNLSGGKFIKELELIASYLFDRNSKPWLSKPSFSNINEKIVTKDEFEKSEESLQLGTTLVFIDGVERLGSDAWDVIKAIYKLSFVKNFIFVLPMNTDELKNNATLTGEHRIEKFIDINRYSLIQNYTPVLRGRGFGEEVVNSLVGILNTEIDGEKLTIRELLQRLDKSSIQVSDNPSIILKKFVNDIWGSHSTASDILTKDFDKIISIQSDFKKEFVSEMAKLTELLNTTKIFSEKEDILNVYNRWCDLNGHGTNQSDLTPHPANSREFNSFIESLLENIKTDIDYFKKEVKKIEKSLETQNEFVPNLEHKKEQNELLLKKAEEELIYEEGKEVKDALKINLIKQSIEQQKKDLLNVDEEINGTQEVILSIENNKNDYSFIEDLNSVYKDLKNQFKKYNKLNEDLETNDHTRVVFQKIKNKLSTIDSKEIDWDEFRKIVLKEILHDEITMEDELKAE